MFRDNLITKVEEYINFIPDMQDEKVNPMLVDFVIEKFKQRRNYPSTFTDEIIENDLSEHLSTMAMAIVDMLNKLGAEGEQSHTENSVTRQYESAYISTSIFCDVLPYVNIY